MSSQSATFLTPEEYLEKERRAEYRSEYFAGEMVAMARSNHDHALIVSNLLTQLGEQLKESRNNVYACNLRLRVTPMGFYTYPDLMVTCDAVQFADEQTDTVLNPRV